MNKAATNHQRGSRNSSRTGAGGVRLKPTRLDELGYVSRGRSRHRPRDDASLYGGDYPFFQTGDIKAANLYLAEYSQTYNEAGLAQSKSWDKGTLCITIAANIAETAILGIPGCFPDSIVGSIPDPDKTDVRFIKYYKKLLHMQPMTRLQCSLWPNVMKGEVQS